MDLADVPEGLDGRLSLRSVELLGFAETVGALERLGALICWAQAQQARAATRLEELFARDIARAAGRENPGLALSLAAAEAGALLNLPHMSAMRLVSESSRLSREHPQTLARLAEGRIGYQHARIILDETQHVPDTPDPDDGANHDAGPADGGGGTGADVPSQGEDSQPTLDLLGQGNADDGAAAPDSAGSRGSADSPDALGNADAEPVSMRQRFEADLLSTAEGRTAAGFGKKARRLRESRFPETISVRHRDALEKRRVCFEALPDGMSCLTAFMAAERGQAIYTALSGAARAGKTAGDPRTMDQLRADAFATVMLDGGGPGDALPPAVRREGTTRPGDPAISKIPAVSKIPAISKIPAAPKVPAVPDIPPALAGKSGQPTDGAEGAAPRRGSRRADRHRGRFRTKTEVMVLINLDTLAGLDEAPAELNGYGPISPEAGRRMILQALSWTPLLQDPATGEILGVGRRRRIPAGLKRWLQARDGTCRFPGCAVSVTRSEIDHTRPWARGGPTEHSNLEHLCPKHHRFKTLGHWKARQPQPGTIEWTSPAGQAYRTEAALDYLGREPAGPGAGPGAGPDAETGAGVGGAAVTGTDVDAGTAAGDGHASGLGASNKRGAWVSAGTGARPDEREDNDPPPF
ncbi:DUF222 domain-containing protein [Arthrobacter sp. Sa2BUA2]|uniref:DUF222 domain-containing protein n=1 Tax=Arthrobacter pullicola TaxID=2762224 RepID=A0ABR8YG71_9MICC|nr:HNH endonuclease [Arthrobacter pullicola]MBD8043219.1 DUF222 domain-containing protein [Arthrobacter pullicola]